MAGRSLKVALSLPMPATTGADALAAMLELITVTWLRLDSTTTSVISPFMDFGFFPPVQQGFTFTLMVPLDAAASLVNTYSTSAAGSRLLRGLQANTATVSATPVVVFTEAERLAKALSDTVTAMSTDGSLTTAVASSGLATSLGYDSTDSLMAGLVVPPVIVAQVPSASPSPWPSGSSVRIESTMAIGGLPAAAYDSATGLLQATSVAQLSAALSRTVAQGGCTSCIAAITSLTNAADQSSLFTFSRTAALSRRLAPASVLVGFEIRGPATALATFSAAVSAAPDLFATAMATNVQAETGWTVGVVLDPKASTPPPPSIVGAAVGGAIGGVVALLILYFLYSRQGSTAAKVDPNPLSTNPK